MTRLDDTAALRRAAAAARRARAAEARRAGRARARLPRVSDRSPLRFVAFAPVRHFFFRFDLDVLLSFSLFFFIYLCTSCFSTFFCFCGGHSLVV